MARLPGYFCDLYLEANNDVNRLSGTPVDLAHLVDASAAPSAPVELGGVVMRCHNPKALSDAVGAVCASVLPAALDELLRRDDGDYDSYFLDPFALFVVGAQVAELEALRAPFAAIVRAALLDYFEGIGEEEGVPASELGAALEEEVTALVAESQPTIELSAVTFRFDAGGSPRGERLLAYLFDLRPPCLEGAPWPERVEL